MKYLKLLIVGFITLFVFNINVYAASANLSASTSSVYVGGSFTVTVNVNSAAAWNIHVNATGPVSGCSITQANASDDALDTNKTFSTTCTATGAGTIHINLSGDVTSAANVTSDVIDGKTVTATVKPSSSPSNNNTSNNTSNNNSNSGTTNKTTPKPTTTTTTKSTNNNVKDVSVDGYTVVKIDDTNYSLSVPNSVSSINVKVTPEDSKAKVSGAGSQDLKIGDNKIEMTVTSESGAQKKITLLVTRKEALELEDLNTALDDSTLEEVNVNIKSNTKITTDNLEKIKESKKTVYFNYYEEELLKYSWIIDGSKLGDKESEFITTISFESEYRDEMLKLSDYNDGLFISLNDSATAPTGSKVRIYVGDKFKDNDTVNVFSYVDGSEKLMLVAGKLNVDDGYVEFEVSDAYDYLIALDNSEKQTAAPAKELSGILPFIIIGIVILAIGGVAVFVIKKKKSNNAAPVNNTADNVDNGVVVTPVSVSPVDVGSSIATPVTQLPVNQVPPAIPVQQVAPAVPEALYGAAPTVPVASEVVPTAAPVVPEAVPCSRGCTSNF